MIWAFGKAAWGGLVSASRGQTLFFVFMLSNSPASGLSIVSTETVIAALAAYYGVSLPMIQARRRA